MRAREALDVLTDGESGRRAVIAGAAEFYEFLAERMPAPHCVARPAFAVVNPHARKASTMPALTVPAGDTHLHVLDASGGEPSLLLLNGAFGTLQNWDKVTARLDGRYRTVRFDARGRGKSGTSAAYSMRAAVEDVGRVIDAAGLTRPVLVGWSHGATTAVRYAAQHPGQVAALVLVDGGFPISMFDEKARQAARAQFRRLGFLMRIAAATGRGARLSPDQAADVVIEHDAVMGELAADFKVLDCPAEFILGTGGHSGAPAKEMRTLRASTAVAQVVNQRVSVFATAACNHTEILRKCPDLVVAAIKAVADQAVPGVARRA